MSGAQLTATRSYGAASFLLEMALGEAQLRERFGRALFDWRKRRGRGDAKRFSQAAAAGELEVSLRTYQHWEAAKHLPRSWADIEAVCEAIGVDAAVILGDAPAEEPRHLRAVSPGSEDPLDRLEERLTAALEVVQEAQAELLALRESRRAASGSPPRRG